MLYKRKHLRLSLWPEDMVSTSKIYKNQNYPKSKREKDGGKSARYGGNWRLWIIPKLDMSDFPDHLPTEVRHVVLGEPELLFAAGQRLEELAGEDTAVVAVLLLRGILRRTSSKLDRTEL